MSALHPLTHESTACVQGITYSNKSVFAANAMQNKYCVALGNYCVAAVSQNPFRTIFVQPERRLNFQWISVC